MTTIDGTRAPGTVLLDGATLDRLDALSVATGRTPAEVLALLVAEALQNLKPKLDGGGAGSGNAPGPDADDVPPSAAVCNAPTVATTLPPACATCGERSEHEVCS